MLTLSDFSEETLHLKPDYEGDVVATLIRANQNKKNRQAVLYIHGFSDYFFHPHVAEAFLEHNINFYALDLRKFGRSLLAYQHPNFFKDIEEFFEEIDVAIDIIQEKSKKEIFLLGHSLGGLISSHYLNNGSKKGAISKAVLNSPFFDFYMPEWKKKLYIPMFKLIVKFIPFASQSRPLSKLYSQSMLKDFFGEWTFNEEWKPKCGFPLFFKTVIAIHSAHQYIKQQSDIKIPILILHASKSYLPKRWNPVLLKSDMVLDVNHIKSIGKTIGTRVQLLEIENAVHDIFLSEKKVRDSALSKMINWLNNSTQ